MPSLKKIWIVRHFPGNHLKLMLLANHCECKLYLSKSVKEKRMILKEKGACWSCLRRGHRIQDCKSKRACGVNGCEKRHHKSLHEEVSTDAIANVCNQLEISNRAYYRFRRSRRRKDGLMSYGIPVHHLASSRTRKQSQKS